MIFGRLNSAVIVTVIMSSYLSNLALFIVYGLSEQVKKIYLSLLVKSLILISLITKSFWTNV